MKCLFWRETSRGRSDASRRRTSATRPLLIGCRPAGSWRERSAPDRCAARRITDAADASTSPAEPYRPVVGWLPCGTCFLQEAFYQPKPVAAHNPDAIRPRGTVACQERTRVRPPRCSTCPREPSPRQRRGATSSTGGLGPSDPSRPGGAAVWATDRPGAENQEAGG